MIALYYLPAYILHLFDIVKGRIMTQLREGQHRAAPDAELPWGSGRVTLDDGTEVYRGSGPVSEDRAYEGRHHVLRRQPVPADCRYCAVVPA